MRSIIVGCGRVGAGLADQLVRAGHEVVLLDLNSEAFSRLLDPGFRGTALRGDGTDEDVLRRAGLAGADYFFALTEGDNRNILAAQMAAETFGVPNVVAKINDPVRAEAYAKLGIATLCRTTRLIDDLGRYAGLEPLPDVDGVRRQSGHRRAGDGHTHARETAAGAPAAAGAAPGEA